MSPITEGKLERLGPQRLYTSGISLNSRMTLVDDLCSTIDCILLGTVNIACQSTQGNGCIWTIEGAKKNLVVALYYKNSCFEDGGEERDRIKNNYTIDDTGECIQIQQEIDSDEHTKSYCAELSIENHKPDLENPNVSCYNVITEGEIHGVDQIDLTEAHDVPMMVDWEACATYVNLNDEISIINEDSAFELLQEGHDNQLRLESPDPLTNDADGADEIDMIEIKDCCIVLERLNMSMLFKDSLTAEIKQEKLVNQHNGKERKIPRSKLQKQTKKENAEERLSRQKASTKPHHCLQCKRSFRLIGHLKQHLRFHSRDNLYECSLCDHNFSSFNDLKCHRRDAHGIKEKTYRCACGKQFFSYHTYTQHVWGHDRDKKPFSCSMCGTRFLLKYRLQRHEDFNCPKKPYKCASCKLKFSDPEQLERHRCGVFVKREILDQHSTQSTCVEENGSEFSQSSKVFDHVEEHKHGDPDKREISDPYLAQPFIGEAAIFACSRCNETFNDFVHLQLHHHNAHGIGEIPYRCPHCEKKFFSEETLIMHMQVHDGEQFKCIHCRQTFSDSLHLRRHEYSVHGIGEIPHQCPLCDKKFFSKELLIQHEGIHRGEDKRDLKLDSELLHALASLKKN